MLLSCDGIDGGVAHTLSHGRVAHGVGSEPCTDGYAASACRDRLCYVHALFIRPTRSRFAKLACSVIIDAWSTSPLGSIGRHRRADIEQMSDAHRWHRRRRTWKRQCDPKNGPVRKQGKPNQSFADLRMCRAAVGRRSSCLCRKGRPNSIVLPKA